MNIYLKLEKLARLAKSDTVLRNKLIATANSQDPLYEFGIASDSVGIYITPYELVAAGEEYSDNQCKSTNGGNPSPYDSFNDIYESFIQSLKIL